ncbi:MAG: GPR1/FUN34/YaaH family transporter [Nocardioides sp.]|uniref:hypothetical protein n=1 Tax=Nocardioides sp. TaxID=35761 RepID=UPI0039E4B0F9
MSALGGINAPKMTDPLPISFGLFGFAFLVYAVRFIDVSSSTITGPTSDALDYALLVGGVAELLAGVLALARGATPHSAWVNGLFGTWLIGFFLLIIHTTPEGAAAAAPTTAGGQSLPSSTVTALQSANESAWHAESVAWFVLCLAIPVIILAIRPIMDRNIVLSIVFLGVIAVIFLFGFGFHEVYQQVSDVVSLKAKEPDLGTAVNLLRISAYCALVAGAGLLFLLGKAVTSAEATRAE